ncbi:MAG: hypothetical protein ACRD50_04145 [Candidatus Acidiferrales bacterium]
MNQHPYLRAYMAGSTVPTVLMLLVLAAFTVARYVFQLSAPIERVIIFPMAIVPNVFGVWNLLYQSIARKHHWSIGAHGAVLPFLLAPIGYTLATALGALETTPSGLLYFNIVRVPYGYLAIFIPVAVGVYYLVWKYIVGYLNRVLEIAA